VEWGVWVSTWGNRAPGGSGAPRAATSVSDSSRPQPGSGRPSAQNAHSRLRSWTTSSGRLGVQPLGLPPAAPAPSKSIHRKSGAKPEYETRRCGQAAREVIAPMPWGSAHTPTDPFAEPAATIAIVPTGAIGIAG